VVIISAFLDLKKNISFSDSLLAPHKGILGHENEGLRLETPILGIILSEYQQHSLVRPNAIDLKKIRLLTPSPRRKPGSRKA
jgi:hypothetical protein